MLHRAQCDISYYSKDMRPLIRHEATYSLNTRPRPHAQQLSLPAYRPSSQSAATTNKNKMVETRDICVEFLI